MNIIDHASIITLFHTHSSLYAVLFLCLNMGRTNTCKAKEEEVLTFEVKQFPCHSNAFLEAKYYILLCFFFPRTTSSPENYWVFLAERFDRFLRIKNIAITSSSSSSSLSKTSAIFDIVMGFFFAAK